MKYNLSARIFPLMFDKYVFSFLNSKGIYVTKKDVRREYKEMIERTPDLPKGNPFIGNILIGCYVLSFYKASENLIDENTFHEMIIILCHSKPMVDGHKNENAFNEKTLIRKQQDAIKSQSSEYEMDWKFTYDRKDDESYNITYTRCGLCQLGKRENCFHLIKYLCEADFITYSLMGAELIRNNTLASGDDFCDFRVNRKKD